MNTKLQELTERLRQEGVEKGKSEAAAILEKAKTEAETLKAEARAEAERIVAQAQEEATELDRKTKSELRLFAAQSVNALRSEVADMITDNIVRSSVTAATADASFMHEIIRKIAESWAEEKEMVIETADAEALKEYFIANAKHLLDKGLEIRNVQGKKAEFAIMPKEGGYKIQCGEEEFAAYFKEFIRAKLLEMLF